VFQTSIQCYLWDLHDEGIDDVLDRLKGEAGVTGISIPILHPGIDQLRPHNGVSPRRFRSTGGAQFQPDTNRYRSTRMRPVVADWLAKSKRNPLKAIADACKERGLNLRGQVVCCDSPIMAARYETSCVKDVFDQQNPTRLCPINLDVREYLASLAEDLSENYPFDAIELDQIAFPADIQSAYPGTLGFVCGETGGWLRSLCFCESCRQLAERDGIDVAGAAETARKHLEYVLTTGEPLTQPIAEFATEHPAVQSFVDWRCQLITSLMQTVKRSCRCRLVIHRNGNPLWSATVFSDIAIHCDALLEECDDMDNSVITQRIQSASQNAGGIERVELGLSACTPPCPDSAAIVRSVKHAMDYGIRSISIANYGLIPLSRLACIRQATRYAQREAKQ